MSRSTIPAAAAAAALVLVSSAVLALGNLENPQPGAWEAGVGAITGWHCTSRNIELRIDGVSVGNAGTGTPRADTASACGRSDTGFSFLVNYGLLRGGTHTIDAYADGVRFGSVTFQAGYLGSEFLSGLSAAHRIPDFPARGQATRVVWQQGKQSFITTGVSQVTGGTLVGTYALQNLWMQASSGVVASTWMPEIAAWGNITFRSNGTYSVNLTLSVNGQSQSTSDAGTYADGGYYLRLDEGVGVIMERGDTFTFFSLAGDTATDTWGSVTMSFVRTDAVASAETTEARRNASPGWIGSIVRAMVSLVPRAP